MRVMSSRVEGSARTRFIVEVGDDDWRTVSQHHFVHPRLRGYVSVGGERRKIDLCLLGVLRGSSGLCGPVEAEDFEK